MRWAERFCTWLAAVVWLALVVLSLLLLARPAQAAGLEVTTVASLPACTNGSPWVILVVDGNSATDCSTGSSTTEVFCACKDGTKAALRSVATDGVALGTDTTGNYVASATASQGLLLTGTEGASLGLQDCAANEVLKRDAGDTAWACAADDDVPEAGDFGALALTGDVTSSGLATTIATNSVALTTDTTGNYVDSATASQGLTLTGSEGGSLGLQDCAAGETLSRNTADNAWACRVREGYALTVQSLVQATMTDGASLFFGSMGIEPATSTALRRVYIPVTGTITSAYIVSNCVTAGSNNAWSMILEIDATSETTIEALSAATNFRTWSNTGLAITATAGHYFEIKSVGPTWTTNPADCTFGGVVFVSVP